MKPHLTVNIPYTFGAIIFPTFQVTYLMIYELACSKRRLLTKYKLALWTKRDKHIHVTEYVIEKKKAFFCILNLVTGVFLAP